MNWVERWKRKARAIYWIIRSRHHVLATDERILIRCNTMQLTVAIDKMIESASDYIQQEDAVNEVKNILKKHIT